MNVSASNGIVCQLILRIDATSVPKISSTNRKQLKTEYFFVLLFLFFVSGCRWTSVAVCYLTVQKRHSSSLDVLNN